MMRNERGITMSALVITIIILIILSGVTLRNILIDNSSQMKAIKNEINTQDNMIEEEKNKIQNVITTYEEDWGL